MGCSCLENNEIFLNNLQIENTKRNFNILHKMQIRVDIQNLKHLNITQYIYIYKTCALSNIVNAHSLIHNLQFQHLKLTIFL